MAYERRDIVGGAVQTTLSSDINSTATSISIADATGWPSGTNGEFMISLTQNGTVEKALVQSRSGTTLTLASSAKRGADDTTAASFTAGATVEHVHTAQDADEANYWVAELAAAYDTAGDLAVADGNNSIVTLAKGSASTVLQVDSGGTLQYGTVTSAMIADGAIVNADVNASAAIAYSKLALSNSVDESDLTASVAGDGLTGGNGTALAVVVDDSTIEIDTDTLRLKDGGITTAKLAAALQAFLVPTGAVQFTAAASAPTGWLIADGSAVSRTTYSTLFALIGTTYGVGDGSTTFNLPDIEGRVIAGKEASATRLTAGASGVDGATLGAAGGDEQHHGHTHTGPSHTHTGPSHTHSLSGGAAGGTPGLLVSGTTAAGAGNTGASGTGATGASGTGATGSTGGGSSENVQPTIVLNPIIKT